MIKKKKQREEIHAFLLNAFVTFVAVRDAPSRILSRDYITHASITRNSGFGSEAPITFTDSENPICRVTRHRKPPRDRIKKTSTHVFTNGLAIFSIVAWYAMPRTTITSKFNIFVAPCVCAAHIGRSSVLFSLHRTAASPSINV